MAAKQTKGMSNTSQKRDTQKNNKGTKQAAYKTDRGRSAQISRRVKQSNQITSGEQETIRDEVVLVITLLISLLLILSYINLCGPIGNGINYVVFGCIGFFAYLFPFALFFMTAFSISNRGNNIARRKLYSGCGMLFVLTSIIQLLTGYEKDMSIFDYFTQGAEFKSGGGIIGGMLVKLLCPLFGTIATVIILIALFVIFFMLITGKALLTYVAKKGEESVEYYREQRILKSQAIEEELEDEDVTDRRKPRIVSFKKEDEPGKGSYDNIKEEPKEPVSFLEQLKKKGKDGGKETKHINNSEVENINLETPMNYDMEEVKAEPVTDFSISGDFRPTSEMIQEVNEIYEEELKKKFGESQIAQEELTTSNDEFTANSDDYSIIKEEFTAIDEEFLPNEAVIQDVFPVQEEAEFNQGHKQFEAPVSQHNLLSSNTAGIPKEGKESQDNNVFTPPIMMQPVVEEKKYVFPSLDLLSKPKASQRGMTDKDLKETATKLQKTLESFGVRVAITNVSCGPAVTRYELQPEQGVKVSRITGLADDIKLNLAAADVRIEAPIPGKAAVGIEVPNKENSAVMLRELLDTKDFKEHSSDIAFAVGKDIGGQPVVTDIARMPHLLIAGATGSGKSVCINTLIMSILYKANPADVKLIMVDPKVVELSVYNGIPHLLIPVVTDPKKASAALNWAVMEMTDRYKKFADLSVRDLKGYNEKVAEIKDLNDPDYQKLPQIVIIVDELADLMMVAPGEVEDAICRLAQMARAAGLHLIIATQRPSVNVITGLIKANVPSRIAFSVSSAIDSRTIIDGSGAEKLLGKGDMLFFPSGYPKPVRVQGAFVSDKEVSAVVDFLKEQNTHTGYSEEVSSQISNVQTSVDNGSSGGSSGRDDYFIEAGKFIIEKDKASIGMLQRVYKIGFNRAARIMDQLADAGVVGPEEGTKPRRVLMSLEEFEQYVDEYV